MGGRHCVATGWLERVGDIRLTRKALELLNGQAWLAGTWITWNHDGRRGLRDGCKTFVLYLHCVLQTFRTSSADINPQASASRFVITSSAIARCVSAMFHKSIASIGLELEAVGGEVSMHLISKLGNYLATDLKYW